MCNSDKSFCLHAHTHIHLFTNKHTVPTCSRLTYIPTSTYSAHTHTVHIYRHSHIPPHLTCSHVHSSASVHTPVCACSHAHTQGTYVHTFKHEHIHRHAHRGTTHPSTALGLWMSRKSCFQDLFSKRRTVLPTRGGPRDVQVTPLLSLCFSFVVHSGFQTFFPTKDPHPCCWARRRADPGADRDPSGHLSACLARPALAHVHSTPNLGMTSFPLCTCHFKSPGPGGPVPRVGLGEAGQLQVGGSFVSSQGPPGARARLGKLQQRPTMASFPPRAASEPGLAGRPLGAPVISCAGSGAPGQPQRAGSGAGHLLPTRWAGSLRPEELLL